MDYSSIAFGGAYLIHQTLNIFDGVRDLNYYYGGGLSAYFWALNYKENFTGEDYESISFAVQGYLGAEYSFDEIPLNLSLERVPTISVD